MQISFGLDFIPFAFVLPFLSLASESVGARWVVELKLLSKVLGLIGATGRSRAFVGPHCECLIIVACPAGSSRLRLRDILFLVLLIAIFILLIFSSLHVQQ